jgi:hypothetical protein
MAENRPQSSDADDDSACGHGHGHGHGEGSPRYKGDWKSWRAPEELPKARIYPEELQAVSWHQPLNEPVWTATYDHLRDDDPVLGLYLNRRARAIPWWIIKNHHVANLTLDGSPMLVALCEMCSSGAAFRAEHAGRRLMFRPHGHYNGTILLEETTTGSLWSPFTGEALAGELRGLALERLPLSQCLWREWRTMHPKSEVLYGEQALRGGHGRKFSPGSPGIGPSFLASLVRPMDERLPYNTLVLGVKNASAARAYPLQTLARIGPVVNDSLGGVDIVVRCLPGTLQALAFRRGLRDQILTFGCSPSGEAYDEQTRSTWNEMGEAISGPLAGAQLEYLDSGIEEWYAFAASNPGAEIFEAR